MDDAGRMRRMDALAGFGKPFQCVGKRESFAPAELGTKGSSFEVLHDNVHADLGTRTEVVDGDDVGVFETSDGDGLALEPMNGGIVGRGLSADDFDGDTSVEGELRGAVDGAHSTLADELVDAVFAVDDEAQERIGRSEWSAVLGADQKMVVEVVRTAGARSAWLDLWGAIGAVPLAWASWAASVPFAPPSRSRFGVYAKEGITGGHTWQIGN